MTKQNTLREIEKKAYMSYHQDGLLDIFVGLYALAFGLGMIADKTLEFGFGTIMPAILIAIVLPIWIEAKRKITMPRIGFVKFGTRGSNKLFALLLGLAVAGLGVFMLFSVFLATGQIRHDLDRLRSCRHREPFRLHYGAETALRVRFAFVCLVRRRLLP